MSHETAVLIGECRVSESAEIGPYCVIGYEGPASEMKPHHHGRTTCVGERVTLGPSVTLYVGATLYEDVVVDPYGRVGRNTEVGPRSRILYGARVHDDVLVGSDSVIAGNVSNRVRLGSRVMHHGRLAHRYNRPTDGWTEAEEPSMSIGDDVVIGAHSLLIGDLSIGDRVYIAGGEVVRRDVPDDSVYYKGRVIPAREWTGSLRESGFWSA